MNNYTSTFGNTVADALPVERAAFIRKTYLHLAGAILAFILLEGYLAFSGLGARIAITTLGTKWGWMLVLLAFMGVSMLANWWANSQTSKAMQYLGLALYTIAEAIIFAPLIFLAQTKAGDGVIVEAGVVSIGLFLGITAVVFLTRKDFSFLGPILMIGGFVALGTIICSIAFGFGLGTIFSFIMVAFAGGSILYETSNVMHRYNTNQHVAASLSLFASVALLFWYILRIYMGSRN
ncbi:MAG: Bax inhibitor-1 family protein [Pyrinomonadaceae bacterium]|nr:Bax inhibitor-1 family protein [Pyrinomonadaceae bacterium]